MDVKVPKKPKKERPVSTPPPPKLSSPFQTPSTAIPELSAPCAPREHFVKSAETPSKHQEGSPQEVKKTFIKDESRRPGSWVSPTGVRRLRALERVHLLTNSSVSSDVREAVRALNARVPYLGQMEHFLCIAIALKFGRITADDYMNYQFRENQLDKRRVLDLAPKPDGGVLRFGHLRLSIQDYFNIDLKPVIRELRTVIEFVYAHLVEIEVLLPPEDEPAPHDNDTGRQERPPDRTDGRPRMTMARPDPRPAGRPSRHTSMDPSAASVIDPRISRRFQDAPSEDRSKRTSNWTSRSIRPSDSLRPEGDIGMMPRPPESQPPRQPETAAPALPGRLRATSGGNTSVVVQRSVANTTSNWTSITNDRASYTGIRRSGARVEKSYKGLGVKSTYFNGSTGHWTSSFELDVDENSDADEESTATAAGENGRTIMSVRRLSFDPAAYGGPEAAQAAAEAFEFKVDKSCQANFGKISGDGRATLGRPPKRTRRSSRESVVPSWRSQVPWNPFGHCCTCSCAEQDHQQLHCRTCLCESPAKLSTQSPQSRRLTLRNGPDVFCKVVLDPAAEFDRAWDECMQDLLNGNTTGTTWKPANVNMQ